MGIGDSVGMESSWIASQKKVHLEYMSLST